MATIPQAQSSGAMMRIFRLGPRFLCSGGCESSGYADVQLIGTWSKDEVCASCGRSTERIIEPFQVQVISSRQDEPLGDVSWAGYDAFVSESVRKRIVSAGINARFVPIRFSPRPASSLVGSDALSSLNLPAWWMLPATALSMQRSQVCRVCGQCDVPNLEGRLRFEWSDKLLLDVCGFPVEYGLKDLLLGESLLQKLTDLRLSNVWCEEKGATRDS